MLATTCLYRRLGSAFPDLGEWHTHRNAQLLTHLGVRLLAQDERELGFSTGEKTVSLIEPWLELAGPKRLRGADITCRQLLTFNIYFQVDT